MIVVSDTSPLNYLILIGAVDVLHVLFGEVFVPSSVADEMRHVGAPAKVREWSSSLPDWCKVVSGKSLDNDGKLGRGEREAIGLASEIRADLLLMDDRLARKRAEELGLRVVGTLNVLEFAGERGLVDFFASIEKLKATNFHVSESLINDLVVRHQSRGSKSEQ